MRIFQTLEQIWAAGPDIKASIKSCKLGRSFTQRGLHAFNALAYRGQMQSVSPLREASVFHHRQEYLHIGQIKVQTLPFGFAEA
jgi:hypothetical protein